MKVRFGVSAGVTVAGSPVTISPPTLLHSCSANCPLGTYLTYYLPVFEQDFGKYPEVAALITAVKSGLMESGSVTVDIPEDELLSSGTEGYRWR